MAKKLLPVGGIAWVDLSVKDAPGVRDFYKAVVGWTPAEVDMGGYADYAMKSPDSGKAVAGVCHARGVNADLPPVWLVYIRVENLDRSMEQCRAHGGEVLVGPKSFGGEARYCVVKDPQGAIAALYDGAIDDPADFG